MLPSHLALDIETVPAKPLEAYSEAVKKKVNDVITRRQEYNSDFDYTYFASIHGDFGKVVCISLGFLTDDGFLKLKSFAGDDEMAILKDFNGIIQSHRGIFVHYNGLNFDIPFLLQRMAHHGIAPANSRFTDLRRYSTNPHFDVMMHYYNWDMQKVLPLGILAELHSMPSPKEDLAGDQVYDSYRNGEWERIIRYCEFDTATTLNLWLKLFYFRPALLPEKYQFSQK